MKNRIEVVLYHDVLCSWCLLADARLALLREEYAGAIDFSYRAFPVRPNESAPAAREVRTLARHYRRVAKEPEGAGIVPDLWTENDPPRSTLPPLVALEAARVQGARERDALLHALRDAAFRRGINVARKDVLIELGERVGLEMGRFLTALESPATLAAVEAEHEEARSRGVRGVPALVLGGEWLIAGARPLAEYRELFAKFLTRRGGALSERLLH
ncbi:MAG: DsbA family oxidoreductase [Deltaproteobacteria bacterium]